MQGVYGDIDQEWSDPINEDVSNEAIQTPDTGFNQRLQAIKDEIDLNLVVIADYIDSLRISNNEMYARYKEEYDKMCEQYDRDVSYATSVGQTSASMSDQERILGNLELCLSSTADFVKYIQQQGANYKEQSIEGEGLPPESLQVVGEERAEVIEMENVGVVRQWWNNRSTESKMMIGAVGIAALIWGVPKILKLAFPGAPEPEPEPEPYIEPELDDIADISE